MDLQSDGAALHASAALSTLPDLRTFADSLTRDQPGIRLHNSATLRTILASKAIRSIVAQHDPSRRPITSGPILDPGLRRRNRSDDRPTDGYRPVRAVLFDKTAANNWSLGWHQDRTIVVHERHEMPGFGPWSYKAGLHHVEPPFGLIEAMLTLRIHLDDVPADNAPLLIAPGSHCAGRVPEREIDALVARCGTRACLAKAGDVWVYATAIVHASAASLAARRRRVLQVDFAAFDLPTPLEWHGI